MKYLRHTFRLAMAMGLVAVGLSTSTRAQSTPTEVAAPRATAPSEAPAAAELGQGIEYVGPDTYILLDADGRPQPVLGMRYEEFVAAWKRMQAADRRDEKPRFTIEDLQISGTLRGEQAELNVVARVRSFAAGSVKVPLGMSEAILLEEPRIDRVGPAASSETTQKSFVGYDTEAGGYVAWIETAADESCLVTLKLLRTMERDANESSVALNLPRSVLSRFALAVPERVVEATTSDGAVKLSAAAEGETQLEVGGARGDFRLSWTTAGAEQSDLTSVMSATGAIGISIDGHSIRSDARVIVRSYGGSFDRIQVRLPPGAQLIEDQGNAGEGESAKYRVRVNEESKDGANESSLVTVEFAERQTGPIEVHLSTEQPLGLTGVESSVELAGFEVLGAVRQFGDVAISVADDWQLRWENSPYVRQVERDELDEALRTTQPTVSFQYDRQPWSLRAEIAGRPMVVHVTPDYTLRIGTDQAELHARLHYQVPGARAFEFRVQLNGWELTSEPIESNGLVDRDRAMVSRDGLLLLPLSQASSRRADIEFTLRRALAIDATKLELPLPAPEADTLATGELAVNADETVELVPNMIASRGLAPVPITRSEPQDSGINGAEYFAYRTFTSEAIFAGRRSVRPRTVLAEVSTQLTLDWQAVRATQDVAFAVRHQPLTELAFELPAGWSIINNQVQILPADLNNDPLVASVTIEQPTHGQPLQVARALLAQPRIGPFRVRAAYKFDPSANEIGTAATFLSLPAPAASQITTHRVDVRTSDDMAVSIDPTGHGSWREESNSQAASALTLVGHGAVSALPIVVGGRSATRAPTTVVERVWLQTWQAGSVIQDRAAIKFRTSDTAVTVELPPSATAADVEVLMDGGLANVSAQQEGRLVVGIPSGSENGNHRLQQHTLELRYRRPAPAGLVTRLVMTPPQLVGNSGLCDVLWHVVLPGDRHLVSVPDTLSAVDPAQWLEVIVGRTAAKSQAELEAWVDAASQPGPTETQNEYLYSGLAPVSVSTIIAPRWLVVLVASGAVLVLTSAWIYLPATRRAWIAIVLATTVAGLAMAFPAQAVLVGQATSLGLLLAALTLWLRRWSGTQTIVAAPPPLATGSTNLRMRSSLRSDSYYAPATVPTSVALEHQPAVGKSTATLLVPEVDR